MEGATLVLVTFNGQCTASGQLHLRGLDETPLISHYNIRSVQNFRIMSLPSLKLTLSIFNKGGYKLTLSRTKYFSALVRNMDQVLQTVKCLLEFHYGQPIENTSCHITQVALNIKDYKISNHKLEYTTLLLFLGYSLGDRAQYLHKSLVFIHNIDHFAHENGAGSYFFTIKENGNNTSSTRNTDKTQKKTNTCSAKDTDSFGGMKLFNTLSCILFINDIDKINDKLTDVRSFLAGLKNFCCHKEKTGQASLQV